MKYQKVRIAVIALLVLAAGVCYGLSRHHGAGREAISLSEPSAVRKAISAGSGSDAGGQTGLYQSAPSGEEEQDADPGREGDKASLSCFVHICGEVVSPGVYELIEGSRVFQAVDRAGGLTENAAAEYLNMAERVSDGMKIVVLSKEEAEADKARAELSLPSEGQKPKVNLNTAAKEELVTLRGIGEAKADDIIRYRESHGGFKTIEDIMKISGIKDAAFQKIKDNITV